MLTYLIAGRTRNAIASFPKLSLEWEGGGVAEEVGGEGEGGGTATAIVHGPLYKTKPTFNKSPKQNISFTQPFVYLHQN